MVLVVALFALHFPWPLDGRGDGWSVLPMTKIAGARFGLVLLLPFTVLVACSEDSDTSAATTSGSTGAGGSAPLCPNGVAPADPKAFAVYECPDADPTNDACCTESPVFCAVLDCADPNGCNVYRKTLYACGGESWGGKLQLETCGAKTFDELEALDGKPCSNEAPCDITTGDLDRRIAVCRDGAWKVLSMYPTRG